MLTDRTKCSFYWLNKKKLCLHTSGKRKNKMLTNTLHI